MTINTNSSVEEFEPHDDLSAATTDAELTDQTSISGIAPLWGERIAVLGDPVDVTWRELHDLIIAHGGEMAAVPDSGTTWIILGSESPDWSTHAPDEWLADGIPPELQVAVRDGEIRVSDESALWERIGWEPPAVALRRLYTPAMLAELAEVSPDIIRRWRRRGLIRPRAIVKRLPYFDFAEIATARRLAELLQSGWSEAQLARRLAEWQRYLPQVDRPLEQLALIARDRRLLLRAGDQLCDPGGQLYFDFDDVGNENLPATTKDENETILSLSAVRAARDAGLTADAAPPPVEVLLEMAAEMEDREDLTAAADLYRQVLARQGPSPEVCFLLADVLYRQGDLTAARERYAMAIELNEDYVEARANLGCVFAELGDRELAIAAFEGALAHHPDYTDVRFHLARLLTELGRRQEAEPHWQRFIELAPHSPWTAEARRQLEYAVQHSTAGNS